MKAQLMINILAQNPEAEVIVRPTPRITNWVNDIKDVNHAKVTEGESYTTGFDQGKDLIILDLCDETLFSDEGGFEIQLPPRQED